jgi:hypothetical protein
MARCAVPELSSRDQAVLADLRRVRLLTGRQLERLHFADLATANARGSARRRSLGRLVSLKLVTTLPRRVGGERAGSAGLVYTLDSAGQRLVAHLAMSAHPGMRRRVRRPWPVGWLFVAHTLDVAELYVRLREGDRHGLWRLIGFDAEPASWHRSPVGPLKPDAYATVETEGWEQHWWIEVDRGTESLPAIRRKLTAYLEAVRAGDQGPAGVVPVVLVTTATEQRAAQVTTLIGSLPDPATQLIQTRAFETAFMPEPIGVQAARPPP